MDENTTALQEEGQDAQEAGTQEQQAKESAPEKVSALQKFINGLLGGGRNADAGEQKADQGEPDAGTGEKPYTQADIDAAIETARQQWKAEADEAERLKKLSPEQRSAEEQQKKDARIADLESQLLKKELYETAVKALEKDGFPAGLAGTLDYSTRERMEETLKSTTQIFKDSLASAIQTRLKGKTPEGLGGAASAENLLRDQIAKNIRGL